ncbi:hypothetical protein [Bifidobacterium criceti]|uniref:Uncharacterized protein n=1 Tax=Bifidobacterium criceti TaxID=1960969 RepID=A0A2A2EED0_9BIFI|nr:hypothetical protein [Bifidobacterium criceti]PAU67381.1 hypothetical protein B1526_1104 [Bifidobacterium criceti]
MNNAYNDIDGHGEGFIWVGDTSRPDAVEQVQRSFNEQLAHAAEQFRITGFKDFSTLECNKYGWPSAFLLLRRDWHDSRMRIQHDTLKEIAFNMAALRSLTPVNSVSTGDFVVRFLDEGGLDEHRILTNVQRTNVLHRHGFLTDDYNKREGCALALNCVRTGFTLALPSESVVVWKTDDNGLIIDLGIYDAVSLRMQMRAYPQLFDKGSMLSDDDMERDITDCLNVLNLIRDAHLNPQEVPQEQLLFLPPHALNKRYEPQQY